MKKIVYVVAVVLLLGAVACGGGNAAEKEFKGLVQGFSVKVAQLNKSLAAAKDDAAKMAVVEEFKKASDAFSKAGDAFEKKYPDFDKAKLENAPEVKSLQKQVQDFMGQAATLLMKNGGDDK